MLLCYPEFLRERSSHCWITQVSLAQADSSCDLSKNLLGVSLCVPIKALRQILATRDHWRSVKDGWRIFPIFSGLMSRRKAEEL